MGVTHVTCCDDDEGGLVDAGAGVGSAAIARGIDGGDSQEQSSMASAHDKQRREASPWPAAENS